jgi:hypothetical protein
VIFLFGLENIRTAAKDMYRLEATVAGEVVICAPHITEFSHAHCKKLGEVGYYTCNYCTKQWERFKEYLAPWSPIAAISTAPVPTARRRGAAPSARDPSLGNARGAVQGTVHNVSYVDPEELTLKIGAVVRMRTCSWCPVRTRYSIGCETLFLRSGQVFRSATRPRTADRSNATADSCTAVQVAWRRSRGSGVGLRGCFKQSCRGR